MPSLNRFKAAQNEPFSGFEDALKEIASGRKRGHWIWYVFPQIAGLGASSMSEAYAIRDRAEAEAYLLDPDLRGRLLRITRAVAAQLHGPSPVVDRLMGSGIDALKLVSSMTLFGTVARDLTARNDEPELRELADAADDVLRVAAAQGHPPCRHTLRRIAER